MKNLYKVLLITSFFTLSNQSILSAGHFEVKFFSSETGYALTPDHLIISDAFNSKNSISLTANSNHSYSAELSSGSYFIIAVKSGYISSQTEFAIGNNEIRYDIFLDPVTSNQKLNPQRIKSLLKPDKALLLGYVVDDITGMPVGGVELKDASSKTLALTGTYGYFEVMLPSRCEERTIVNLTFVKEPFTDTKYENFEITPNTDFIFTVRMKSGTPIKQNNSVSDKCEECTSPALFNDMAISGFVLPMNIRVGRNCTGTNCTYAEVYTLQTYCKYVLPAEIYACWGNLSGGMNSLQACAVAVRSYGMYFVYNPINPALYDICDNTYCQFMGSVTSTNTNNAVDNTFGYILTNSSGVVRSEYSAENNNKGCGNGYQGRSSGRAFMTRSA
jgi:hypothetical protein